MAEESYGTTDIPSDFQTVSSGGTVPRSSFFDDSIVLVGAMDSTNGNASVNERHTMNTTSDARTAFGDNTELTRHVRLAISNGAGRINAVPVETTEVTGESLGTDGSLDNVPMDPNVHPNFDITVDDSTIDVEITYEESPSSPTSDTLLVNPVNGAYNADSTGYSVNYEYADYESAIDVAVYDGRPDRTTAVLHENETTLQYLDDQLNAAYDDYNFSTGFMGTMPDASSSYTPNVTSRKVAVVSSSRDESGDYHNRLAAAYAGSVAGQPLGQSATRNRLEDVDAVRTEHTVQDAQSLADNGVTPLKFRDEVFVVKDVTTSDDNVFHRLYASEVTNEAILTIHNITDSYIGEHQHVDNRGDLAASIRGQLRSMRDEEPRQLDDYFLDVYEDENDPTITNIDLGLDIINVMDNIVIDMTVGDVLRFNSQT